jgi:hypothetical protein
MLARRQHNQIDPLTVQKTEHGFHRIVTAGDDLLDAQAELRDRRSRTALGQQSPTFQRPRTAGKSSICESPFGETFSSVSRDFASKAALSA